MPAHCPQSAWHVWQFSFPLQYVSPQTATVEIIMLPLFVVFKLSFAINVIYSVALVFSGVVIVNLFVVEFTNNAIESFPLNL